MKFKPKPLDYFYILNNGLKIPCLGLGTARMEEIPEIIYYSIKDGIRLIDTATMYNNEELVGKGIKKALDDKIVSREELFIVTKLYVDSKMDPEIEIQKSLKLLQLDYIDLYLDHWPISYRYDEDEKTHIKNTPLHEFWPRMERLVEKGYTKSIGVSNYNIQSLCNLLSVCKIKPVCNEVEFHPYLYQKNLLDFCNKVNIRLIAFTPFLKGGYIHKMYKDNLPQLLEENVLKELAVKYNKTPGQIVLNWLYCLGIIPIPRTNNPKRMEENLGACYFKMEESDLKKISQLNKNARFCNPLLWNERYQNIPYFS